MHKYNISCMKLSPISLDSKNMLMLKEMKKGENQIADGTKEKSQNLACDLEIEKKNAWVARI